MVLILPFPIFGDSVFTGQLQWADLEDIYDVVAIGDVGNRSLYELPTGKKPLMDALLEYFPREKTAIETFFDEVTEGAEDE